MNLSFKTLIAIAMVIAAAASSGQVQADCGLKSCCKLVNSCCPKCNYCCKLDAEEVEVEKSCFEVECETICIPRVVFPWQTGKCCFFGCGTKSKSCGSCESCDGRGCSKCSNCVHNGAKLRTIKKLKTKKYKCPECEYTWTAEEVPCGACCGSACGGACKDGRDGACNGACDGACDAGCDTAAPVSPSHQPVPAPAAYTDQHSAGMAPVEIQ